MENCSIFGLFRTKKKAGAELRNKKGFCGAKIWKNFENKVQKLTNLTEKMDFLGKKKAEAELKKKKKDLLGQKLG